jgi:sensor histidine kinase YesM
VPWPVLFIYFKPVKPKRLILHLLFWLVQYSISLYNELYLSVSFSHHPSADLFLKAALSVGLIFVIKVLATYYTLYRLIPKWIKDPGRARLYLEAIATVLFATLFIRMITQLIVWRLIYNEAGISLSNTQLAARYFYSMLDLLQVLGLAAAIKLLKLRVTAVKQEKAMVQEKLRSELLHLKSQLNPHFLFNAINSIYALARAQSALTADAVMQLSKILRYMLYETGQKTIPLQDEIKIIEDYIALQQLRYSKRLSVTLEKELDDHDAHVVPLLLLPLVENAYKHGSEEGGHIEIKITLHHQQLYVGITNPVVETPHKTPGEEGIGLSNIRRRLQLLYRDFSLQTYLKENTFKVELNTNLSSYAGIELFDR